MDRTDRVLLAAYLAVAAFGTLGHCLLVNDGAVFGTSSWLGNAWDLYFGQLASRAVSTLLSFGPAQVVAWVVPLSARAFDLLLHLLYFAAPLALWLVLLKIEPHRLFSRLYLALVLALVYFPSEVTASAGLWMIWLAVASDPRRSLSQVIAATALLGGLMIFTHPIVLAMSLIFVVIGGALRAFGRPIPSRSLMAAAALFVVLLLGYLATSALLPPTNPLLVAVWAAGRTQFLHPIALINEVGRFPAIGVLWLLLLAPGVLGRFGTVPFVALAILGLWFAAAGTNLLTYLVVRHTALYVLALAVTLALADPLRWLQDARRNLALYAAITATAAASYGADLWLFGRYVDQRLAPGYHNIEALKDEPWPAPYLKNTLAHIAFKWGAEPDYVRDVVLPTYDWYRMTLAFYSYFRSDRQSVLFHPSGRPEDFLPFECAAVERTPPRDATDRTFLAFLAANYCVRR